MFSDKKNVLQLVALLHSHGIRKVVLCPGSRDIPIVQTIISCPDFIPYSITDERSAGFFALGLSLENGTREPVAVVVTSGSALVNLHPAVSEAFYQQVPLLVISADRPAAWIGQMDGQTMPQSNVFGSLVKKSVSLPEINTDEEEWYCNRLINEALLELDHHGKGPVHINVPISDPFFSCTVDKLPHVRKIRRYKARSGMAGVQDLVTALARYSKVMIILGQSPEPLSVNYNQICQQSVFFCENLSNSIALGDERCTKLDLLLSVPNVPYAQIQPDLVITLGGHIISKRVKKFLRAFPPQDHWHVTPDGMVSDLFQALTVVVEDNVMHFITKLEQAWQLWQRQIEESLAVTASAENQISIFMSQDSSILGSEHHGHSSFGSHSNRLMKTGFNSSSLTERQQERQAEQQRQFKEFQEAQRSQQLRYEEQHSYRDWVMSLCHSLPPDLNFAYSSMQAVGKLINKLPCPSVLHLANSSSVRYAQFFSLPKHGGVTVRGNRGINGIDGSLSTALGAAAASSVLNFIIIGDLSFFYDMNALWQYYIRPNVRILLINNSGGEIFRTLPGLELSPRGQRYVCGTHHTSAAAWAQSQGFTYYSATNEAELEQGLKELVRPIAFPLHKHSQKGRIIVHGSAAAAAAAAAHSAAQHAAAHHAPAVAAHLTPAGALSSQMHMPARAAHLDPAPLTKAIAQATADFDVRSSTSGNSSSGVSYSSPELNPNTMGANLSNSAQGYGAKSGAAMVSGASSAPGMNSHPETSAHPETSIKPGTGNTSLFDANAPQGAVMAHGPSGTMSDVPHDASPILLEVFTNEADDVAELKRVMATMVLS